ncbi:MAG: FAD-binding protein [Lachnospiraceae bacterium]|nr:FAD-binding protein [Lachnospiraceae bacterium]
MAIKEKEITNLVIGSGAAGLCTALRLWELGETDTALLTENMNSGTSRNTGSDKQTYYKLSLSGSDMDSVGAMAGDLFAGGAVDGDLALCEASLSTRGFFHLVELGVPFPCDEYSEYMGYKTDHDRGRRATSAGPYTSKKMTEALEKALRRTEVTILDGYQAIRLLCIRNVIKGVLCLDKTTGAEDYLLIRSRNVVLATGGPAGIYRDSVYPASQLGGSGMAFAAGVHGKNLTEWQFGMASIRPRWNVSGTYMQVLPRFISTDQNRENAREFLSDYFTDEGQMLSLIFMKGYQWPFDVRKIQDGSSIIDLLVYRETILRGRRVFLDFRDNPGNKPIPFDKLSPEAYEYLKKGGALFGTPIERLRHMNEPAISFYADHQVDLYTEPLEIAVCAQHNNGGLATDANWETCIRGLFAVGEVNGSHGVTRPGGSALNAGQAGAIRVSESIHLRRLAEEDSPEETASLTKEDEELLYEQVQQFISMPAQALGTRTAGDLWQELTAEMSAAGGMIRQAETIRAAQQKTDDLLAHFEATVKRPEASQLSIYYRLYDMLMTRKMYLYAMQDYIQAQAGSRGSALYTASDGIKPTGGTPEEELPELFRCRLEDGSLNSRIQEIVLTENGSVHTSWRPVRPVPQPDDFFENQWRAYRQRNKLN